MATPETIRTILAATDFSATGNAGIAWAAELARQHSARLVLFHALVPAAPASPAPEFVPLPATFYEDVRDTARERLTRSAADLRQTGLTVEAVLEVGSSSPAILAAARRLAADLLVVGTRGLTGWKRLLLGSTAAHVVRSAPCPVFTVHPEDAGRHRPVRTVLVPTDFSHDAAAATEAALRVLGPARDAQVFLLHVYHVPIEFVAPLPVPVLLESVTRVERDARSEIEAAAGRLERPGLRIETRICEGYPPQAIVDEARAVSADVIAMGTHGRSGVKRLLLGSTAERVLAGAPCPVLVIRHPQAP